MQKEEETTQNKVQQKTMKEQVKGQHHHSQSKRIRNFKKFLTDKKLTDKKMDSLKFAVNDLKFYELNNILHNYFENKRNLQKTIKNAHFVLQKCFDLRYIVICSYIKVLNKNKETVKKYCNLQEIKKIEKDIHNLDYPYFCQAFSLKISENIIKNLINYYAEDGNFKHAFKLLDYTKTKNLHQYVDILVQSAHKNEFKSMVPSLKKLGFTKKHYPQIQESLLMSSVIFFYKSEGWEKVEEIFCHYPKVLAFAVNKMLSEKNDKLLNEAVGVCARNPQILNFVKSSKIIKEKLNTNPQITPNKLHTNEFRPSIKGEYLSFSDFGLTEQQVFFVDPKKHNIEKILQQIISSDIIGIDTESMVAKSVFDSDFDILATLQIATKKGAWVFDPINCDKNNFAKYFEEFLNNPNKIVVGHTVMDDFNLILQTLGVKNYECKIVELKDIFVTIHPKERKNLANMSHVMLGKPICKEYTLTDWGRRPLLKNQIHYAAMDAFIVIKIYEQLLKQMQKEEKQQLLK